MRGVRIVNMPPKMSKKTDVTRQVTQADEVNDGSGPQLPQAYTGKDVIVGIIDTGFDLTHPMFKDKDGNLRIKGYYEPGSSSLGGEKVVITYFNGQQDTLSGSAYYKPEELLDTLKVMDPAGSHGSHCISIAAGSPKSHSAASLLSLTSSFATLPNPRTTATRGIFWKVSTSWSRRR